MSISPLSAGPHLVQIHAGPTHVATDFEFICVLILLCLEGFFLPCCPPYALTLTVFPFPLLQGSLSCEGRDLMETCHLGLSVPGTFTLFTLSNCGSLYFFWGIYLC